MTKPSTAAIIPVYNVEKYLTRCIDSCLRQTWQFDEILLIDDGSTDSSGVMCDRLAEENPSIRVIHQQNGGLSAARNAGIAEARSDRVTFIDSDDWIAPNYLEALSSAMDELDADMAFCSLMRASSEEEYSQKLNAGKPLSEPSRYDAREFLEIMMRIRGNRTVHYACGKLYRKNILEEQHFPVGIYNEDVEGCFKTALNSSIIAEVKAPLYGYFQNEESITGGSFGENYLNLKEVWQRVVHIAEERAPEWTEAASYNERRADFTILCDMLLHGDALSDERYEEERLAIQRRLRRNLGNLLMGSMPANRKIFGIALAYFYRPVRTVFRKTGVSRIERSEV